MYYTYTTIEPSEKQIDKLYKKHLRPFNFFGIKIPKIVIMSYSVDDEDNIGFVTLYTIYGKKIEYQLRGEEPMFVSFTGFGRIKYDIAYPIKRHKKMYEFLKNKAIICENNFWNGGEI